MNNEISSFYNRVFGEKFTLSGYALVILIAAGDLAMLLGELRVFQVGHTLTDSRLLAFGFVAVSSVPFYFGQIAFVYKRANWMQIAIAVCLVLMGLLVSAYYGFADYLIQTNTVIDVANGVSFAVDKQSLYFVAVGGASLFVVACLLFTLVDTGIANNLKMSRMEGRAELAEKEIELRTSLLEKLTTLQANEEALKKQYGDHYNEVLAQFGGKPKNPTTGDGKK